MEGTRRRRVGLVSCVKKKSPTPRPAEDLYRSAYFGKMRAYVEASCDEWWILSALHGLVHPKQILAPYEATLKGMTRSNQREWARKVMEQIGHAFPNPSVVEFEIHGGSGYTRDLVLRLVSAGYSVRAPAPSLPIGKKMQWYGRNPPHPKG